MGGPYTNFIMYQLSKENYEYRKENEVLKDMIQKFLFGEYSKYRLNQEYQQLIDKENRFKEGKK
jgi:hypothetical protein